MGWCTFCRRPAVQRLWARRCPLDREVRGRKAVEDVRITLCRNHLNERVGGRKPLVKDGWAYD